MRKFSLLIASLWLVGVFLILFQSPAHAASIPTFNATFMDYSSGDLNTRFSVSSPSFSFVSSTILTDPFVIPVNDPGAVITLGLGFGAQLIPGHIVIDGQTRDVPFSGAGNVSSFFRLPVLPPSSSLTLTLPAQAQGIFVASFDAAGTNPIAEIFITLSGEEMLSFVSSSSGQESLIGASFVVPEPTGFSLLAVGILSLTALSSWKRVRANIELFFG
jgi:hypothetical protein